MAGVVEIEKSELNDVEAASSPHGAQRELTTTVRWVAHASPKLSVTFIRMYCIRSTCTYDCTPCGYNSYLCTEYRT